jgi:flagellin-specific chaperone FliS
MERGGQVASNLLTFYEGLRANLCRAQFQVSKKTLLQQITDLMTLREAWAEVDRAESAGSAPKPVSLPATVPNGSPDQPVRAHWKA